MDVRLPTAVARSRMSDARDMAGQVEAFVVRCERTGGQHVLARTDVRIVGGALSYTCASCGGGLVHELRLWPRAPDARESEG